MTPGRRWGCIHYDDWPSISVIRDAQQWRHRLVCPFLDVVLPWFTWSASVAPAPSTVPCRFLYAYTECIGVGLCLVEMDTWHRRGYLAGTDLISICGGALTEFFVRRNMRILRIGPSELLPLCRVTCRAFGVRRYYIILVTLFMHRQISQICCRN